MEHGSPLLTHEWFLSAWEAFHAEDELSIVLVLKDSMVAAIAPLVLVKRKLVKRLELIGAACLYEPCGFLFETIADLEELLIQVTGLGLPLLLQRIPGDSALGDLFRRLPKRKGIKIQSNTAGTQQVTLKDTWENYYRNLSGRRRYDHRRGMKRASVSGSVTYTTLTPAHTEIEQCLERFYRVEAKSWKGRKGSALLLRTDLRRFFERYAQRISTREMFQLNVLQIDGEDAAIQLSVIYAGRLWVLKIGYDEKWSKCSPGVLLTMHSIKDAFEQKLATYEFLGIEEDWLNVWATGVQRHMVVAFFPFSYHGLSLLSADVMEHGWKKVATTTRRICTRIRRADSLFFS
jgi:CelD/BcsL family acetyltransferase involved in cellulose biosynthesis